MIRNVLVVLLAFTPAFNVFVSSAPTPAKKSEIIPNQYIITFVPQKRTAIRTLDTSTTHVTFHSYNPNPIYTKLIHLTTFI